MPLPGAEPDSPEAVIAWIHRESVRHDRFAHVAQRSDEHRAEHDCDVFPSSDGATLGVIAAATGAERILEIGCGLGYSALWLAVGSSPDGMVETIERDPLHVALAHEHVVSEGLDDRITIFEGEATTVLASLIGPYDLIFVDSDVADYMAHLDHFSRLLRPRGLLLSSNLFPGQYGPKIAGLENAVAYRECLLEDSQWFTAFLPNRKALSVHR